MSAERSQSRSRVSEKPGFGLRPGSPILFPVRVRRSGVLRLAPVSLVDGGGGVGAGGGGGMQFGCLAPGAWVQVGLRSDRHKDRVGLSLRQNGRNVGQSRPPGAELDSTHSTALHCHAAAPRAQPPPPPPTCVPQADASDRTNATFSFHSSGNGPRVLSTRIEGASKVQVWTRPSAPAARAFPQPSGIVPSPPPPSWFVLGGGGGAGAVRVWRGAAFHCWGPLPSQATGAAVRAFRGCRAPVRGPPAPPARGCEGRRRRQCARAANAAGGATSGLALAAVRRTVCCDPSVGGRAWHLLVLHGPPARASQDHRSLSMWFASRLRAQWSGFGCVRRRKVGLPAPTRSPPPHRRPPPTGTAHAQRPPLATHGSGGNHNVHA